MINNRDLRVIRSLVYSSVWCEPWPTRQVWLYMLSAASEEGIVMIHPAMLAKRAEVSEAESHEALRFLSSPDHRNTQAPPDGRCIESVGDNMWQIRTSEDIAMMSAHDFEYRNGQWCTYILEAVGSGMVKIGRTKKLDERVASIRTGCPHAIRIALVLPGNRESELHERFRQDRIRLEWFDLSTEIRSFINAEYEKEFHSNPTPKPQLIHRQNDTDTDGAAGIRGEIPTSPTTVLLRGAEDRVCVDPAGAGSGPSPSPPSQGLGLDRDRGGPGVAVSHPRQGITDLVNLFLTRINAALKECGGHRPIALMDRGGAGERELRARLASSLTPTADLDHVLTIAIAESRATDPPTLRWLGWNLADVKTWDVKLRTSLAEVQHKGPRSALSLVDSAVEKLVADSKRGGS